MKSSIAPLQPSIPTPRLSPASVRQRRARLLLREVDILLKEDGIATAITALMEVRLKTPLNTTIRQWLSDYRDMLDAWQAGLMPEIVHEFFTYGYRRARATAYRLNRNISHHRQMALYLTCLRVLEEMDERFQRSMTDSEEEPPESPPHVTSLTDVSRETIENGTTY